MFNLTVYSRRFLLLFITLNSALIKILGDTYDESEEYYNASEIGEIIDRKNHSVIFFHGFGEDEDTWNRQLRNNIQHANIVLPFAKQMQLTYLKGEKLTAWFDFKGPDKIEEYDEKGIKYSVTLCHALIRREIKNGVPSSNIVVGGFNQGGVVALLGGLTFKEKLAGIAVLSAWFPYYNNFSDKWVTSNRNIPIFVCHGTEDTLVPYQESVKLVEQVKKYSNNVKFKAFKGLDHTTSDIELRAIYDFINLVLFGPLYGTLPTASYFTGTLSTIGLSSKITYNT